MVNGILLRRFVIRKPENIPWDEVGADYVVDCTGVFTNKSNAESHLEVCINCLNVGCVLSMKETINCSICGGCLTNMFVRGQGR